MNAGAQLAAVTGSLALENLVKPALEALGAEGKTVDLAGLFDAVFTDPMTHGFLDTKNPVLVGSVTEGTIMPNPGSPDLPLDQIPWYDTLHPTAALHGVIGVFEATTLIADETVFLGDGPNFRVTGSGQDLLKGQCGQDLLTDAERAAAEDELALAGGLPPSGDFAFASLELTVKDVEEIVFLDDRALTDAFAGTGIRAFEADLWGLA